jgi:hypothetical protein
VSSWERKSEHKSKAAANREAVWLKRAGYETKITQVAYLRPRYAVLVKKP